MITKYIRAYIGKDHNFHIRYVRKAYRKARWKKRNKRYYIRDADAFLQLWIELLDDMMQRDLDRQLSEIEAVIIGDRGVREQLKHADGIALFPEATTYIAERPW